MGAMIWSFSPWLVFLAVSRVASPYWALAAGGAAAVIVLIRAIRLHKVHLPLDVVGVIFFPLVGAILGATHPKDIDTWGRYAQAMAHGSLTVIVFATILFGHPFTESYAREQVSTAVAKSSAFHTFNRKITAIFGLAFLLGTISMVIAGSVDSRQFLLRIAVPFGALGLAYFYTQKQANAVAKPTS